VLQIEWPPRVGNTWTVLEVDGVEWASGPTFVAESGMAKCSPEGAHSRLIETMDRITIALASKFSLGSTLDILAAALEEADSDVGSVELARDCDSGGSGADHA